MKTKPSDLKQNLFKAGIGLAAFGFAATGHDLASPLMTALIGMAGSLAGQYGEQLCMPFITKKWLSQREEVVNHHIQRALVAAIRSALNELEEDYVNRADVSSKEAKAVREFFAVLRSRSDLEYVEATQNELTRQEILDYVYDRQAAARHLQDRLRIKLDSSADDEFYFTDRFVTYFPGRFAERVQFHLKEEIKGGDEDQEKAKKAMDLLFFETLNAALNDLREKQQTGQDALKKLLDDTLATGAQTLQQVEFYGEIWISAIRQNRTQLDKIEQKQEQTLEQLGYVRADMATKADVAALGSTFVQLFSQSVQPGLLLSEQFQTLSQTLRAAEQAFADSQTNLVNAQDSLTALETTIDQNPAIASALDATLQQQRKDRDRTSQEVLTSDSRQQQAKQALNAFLNDVAATQQAIQNATSHRADEARQLFEAGKFTEADAALNADELDRDLAELQQQRETVQQYGVQLAQDFILKATTTTLTKGDNWYGATRQFYEKAISASESYDTCFALAYFLQSHNQHAGAVSYYERALHLSADAGQRATTLNNLANLYSDTSRMSPAEAAYNEALQIRRQLAQDNPAAYRPDVAMTLNNLGLLYKATSRMSPAEAAYDEALLIYRQLAQDNPAAYRPNVATTLNNLGLLYSDTSRMSPAEAAYDEALLIYRQLAQDNPAAYRPDVAMTLNNLAILYKATSRMSPAEAAYNEALQIRRQLAQDNPAAYRPNVATTLNNLGLLYSDTSRMSPAEDAYDEALQIRRQLAQDNPAAYQPDVAMTLNNLANLYSDTSRMSPAEAAYDEALLIYRQLAQDNPAAYRPNVATTLNNLANLYSDTSRMSPAEAAYDEALLIYRQLAQDNPAAYRPNVATTLNNLANLYSDTSRMSPAEAAYDEALLIYRQLAQDNPAAYRPDVAMTLNNLAILYKATSRMSPAEDAYDEALQIRRQLAQDNPAAYQPDVAMTLNNLANLYSDTSRMSPAEDAFDEALTIRLELARENPDAYAIVVAETATNKSIFYLQLPEPNREQSIDSALLALYYALPYRERVPYADTLSQEAISICEEWGIDWRAELQKRFESKDGPTD